LTNTVVHHDDVANSVHYVTMYVGRKKKPPHGPGP